MTLLLDREDLRKVLDWSSVIDAIGSGFADLSAGRVTQPTRTVIRSDDPPGAYLLMPCAIPTSRVLGTKIATVYPRNPAAGLATIAALYVLADFQTGRPLAVMDAGYMTAFRTAAATALATRVLARPDARTVGVFGTGTQAEFHVRAMAHLLPEAAITVAGSTREKASSFARRLEKEGLLVSASDSAAAASSDVVVAATSATSPVFDGALLRAGAHVNGVGSHQPAIRELDTETIVRSTVFADAYDTLWAEAGDILIPIEEGRIDRDHVRAEIGEVLLGKRPGRSSEAEITLFKSNGVAFQDAVTGAIAFKRAKQAGLGTTFDFGG